MLARKKLAKLARKRKAQALLKNPPKTIIVPSVKELSKIRKDRTQWVNLVPRYSHRSSGEVISRPNIAPTLKGMRRQDTIKYTGSEIIGITVLHKSCLQPVSSKEAAIDAARMRRG